jgi:dolichol-phosphate mannosyltransferase
LGEACIDTPAAFPDFRNFALPMNSALTVVIPFYNEAGCAGEVLAEIRRAQPEAEIVAVDDGSTDGTDAVLRGAPGVRVVTLGKNCGQSAALYAGLRAASGAIVAMMDGDGQNDPADIPALLDRRDAGLSLVAGLRRVRNDSLSKRLASRLANGVRDAILRDGCRDSGCGLKLFRRDAFLDLPAFVALHRFLPALFLSQGHGVAYVDVGHRPRRAGTSKYGNLRRALVGILDLAGVFWLQRRAVRPTAITEDRPGP